VANLIEYDVYVTMKVWFCRVEMPT